MYKYYSDLPIITDKVNPSINGIVTVSKELKGFKPVEDKKESDKVNYRELAEKAGLEGDELKKFMKKNEANKIKQLEQLEG